MTRMLSVEHTADLKAQIAQTIRSKRIELGHTRAELAKAMGCSIPTAAALETKGEGSLENFIRAMSALEMEKALMQVLTPAPGKETRQRVHREDASKIKW